jgi:MFS family permease
VPARLPRTVIVLGWVSLFADVSSEMIYPLLPLFVTGVLGASATALGWVEGAALAVVAVLTAYAGWRSDRVRRRVRYVRIGYALPVIGKAVVAAAVAWPMVLAGRTIDRIGKGIRSSPRDALIADATAAVDRGRAFGLHRAMDTAGAFIGVVLAAVLMWRLAPRDGALDGWGFRVVFFVAAALSVISAALTWVLREVPPAVSVADTGPDRSTALGLSRSYWIVVAVMVVFTLANSSDTFLLLRAADVGLAPWQVVLAYALYNAVYALVSYPAGVISDRIGRWRVIGVGWAIYAAVYAGFAITGRAGVWPLFAVYGLYMALTDGVGKAVVADHAPRERRGLALGVFYLANGGAAVVASVAAGLLWDRVGHNAPFWLGAIGAATALALVPVAARLSTTAVR